MGAVDQHGLDLFFRKSKYNLLKLKHMYNSLVALNYDFKTQDYI
jgi:hypothetical protein